MLRRPARAKVACNQIADLSGLKTVYSIKPDICVSYGDPRGYGSGTFEAIFLNPFERACLYDATTGDSYVTRSFSEDWNRALGQTRSLAANCGDLSLASHHEHRTPLAMLVAMIAGQPACGILFGNRLPNRNRETDFVKSVQHLQVNDHRNYLRDHQSAPKR
jgi:hypothetical protein